MPLYLTRFSYTPETWARLISRPEDRAQAARSYIESVGGKLHGFWYAFGTHDWLQPVGGAGQRVHGLGRPGDQRRGCAQLLRDDCAPDGRRNPGGPAPGRTGSVPGSRRIASARRGRLPAERRDAQGGRGGGSCSSIGDTAGVEADQD